MIIKYWKINKLQAKKAAGRYIRYTKKFYEFFKKKKRQGRSVQKKLNLSKFVN